jgi:cellobiose phosphorylase
MQEEVRWSAGRVLALVGITPDSASWNWLRPRPFSDFVTPDPEDGEEDDFLLLLPLRSRQPAAARKLLIEAAGRQKASGRFGGDTDEPDPRHDRSHREIAFLVACAELSAAAEGNGILDEVVPFADGGNGPLWEHVVRAATWIRDSLGTGPHGLLRLLAGDCDPTLDRVGVGGIGESALNTVMMIYALDALTDRARRRKEERLAANWSAWTRALRAAMDEHHGERVFIRAFTDQGMPVGDGNDTIFTDVQAWAVLARCGTEARRQEALTAVLTAAGEAPVPTLSIPLALPAPGISSRRIAPGDPGNGGFSMTTAAWLIRALAREHRHREALAVWERCAIRRRAAAPGYPPAPFLTNAPRTASRHAGARAGGPALGFDAPHWAGPDIRATAWHEFALAAALGNQSG